MEEEFDSKWMMSIVIKTLSYPSPPQSFPIYDAENFLESFAGVQSVELPKYNYHIQLFLNGANPKWEEPINNKGGRFLIFFSTNIDAIRAFAIFTTDWLSNKIEFSANIVGVLVSIKLNAFNIQIWVNDGFDSSALAQRWQYLYNYFISIRTKLLLDMEFHVHPTYRVYNTPKSDVRTQANQIPSFGEYIDRFYGLTRQHAVEIPSFDLSVVQIHKRSRVERRQKPSFVDSVNSISNYQ